MWQYKFQLHLSSSLAIMNYPPPPPPPPSPHPHPHPPLHPWIKLFLPEASFGLGVLSLPASVCLCVGPCVNHELVHAITHHPFQLGSPNLDQRCKRPWLRSGGGWGCEVSCGGHHRPRGKTTKGSALDGAVFDITQILAYLVHNMSRSQLYLGFGHFGWLPSFFGQ